MAPFLLLFDSSRCEWAEPHLARNYDDWKTVDQTSINNEHVSTKLQPTSGGPDSHTPQPCGVWKQLIPPVSWVDNTLKVTINMLTIQWNSGPKNINKMFNLMKLAVWGLSPASWRWPKACRRGGSRCLLRIIISQNCRLKLKIAH